MFISIVRTIVPAIWAWAVTQLVTALPILEPLRADLLEYAEPLAALVGVIAFGAWYALIRWLEPRMPEWLAKALFGSAQRPEYSGGKHSTKAPTSAPPVHESTYPGDGR